MHPRGRTIYVATFIKRWADGGVIRRKMPQTGHSAFGIFGLRGKRRVYEPHLLYVNDYDFNPPWRNGWGTDVYEFDPKPNGEPYPHVILLTHQHSSCSENSILRGDLEVIVTVMRNRANQLVRDGEENSARTNQRKLQFPYESRFPVLMISVYAPTNIRIYYACMDNLRLHIRQSGTWEATAFSNDFNFLAMVFLSNAHSGFHQPPVIQPPPIVQPRPIIQPLTVIPPRPSQQLMSSRGSTAIRTYISPKNDIELGGPTTIDPGPNSHSKKSLD